MQTSHLAPGQPMQQQNQAAGQPGAPAYAQQPQQGMMPQQQPPPQQQQRTSSHGVGVSYTAAQQQQQQQQQQGQQQQHFPHQGLNGGWQSDKDYAERRQMIAKIVHLLQQRKPNAPQEWLKKLPQMAKRLEESLYRSAKSFDEYNDASTLKNRLQQLAVNIGMKTKKMQQQQALMQQRGGQPQQPQQYMQQQPQQPQQPQQQRPPQPGQPLVAPQQQRPPVPQQVQAPAPQNRMVSLSDINPIIGGQPQQSAPPPAAPRPAPAPFAQPAQAPPPVQPVPPQAQAPAGAAPVPGPNGSAVPTSRQVSDRQQVLRHQQQRLLLLRHAAKCQHEDGRCPVTPHCAGMKRLWKHIAECKNQKCVVPHCVSSRYVLSHYHRCKDVRCPVCGPVREAIHRSHEKQKQMQALKQRHQQAVQQQSMRGSVTSVGSGGPPTAVSAAAPTSTATSGALPVGAASSGEPAAKRQRTSQVLGPPGFAVQSQRPLQPPGARPGIASSTAKPPYYSSSGQQPQHPGAPGARPQVAQVPGIAFSNGQVIMPKHSGPKPQEDHTLINCFSVEQIETHIASLSNGLQLSPQKLKTKCLEVLKVLQSHQHGWVFNSPVDPVELGLPDYFEVIKKPMDLGTIRKKLENGVYHNLREFEGHVNLTFDNAMLYNPEGSVVYNMAKEMKDKFKQDYAKMMVVLNQEEDVKRRNGEACSLCGCEKLLFEPPVFYCNGMNCPSKRIRRNGYYYVGGNNQYHWCQQCFQEIRDNSTIDLGDMQIKKESLVKKKNDEVHEESWVQCDRCERWVHQICALFNTRQNKDQRSEYACPRCTIAERKAKGQLEATSTTPMAEDLPRTLLSEYLEKHVRDKVNEFIERKSQEKSATEGISLDEARKKLQMGGAITIRQVTSMDRKLEVRERMKRRYAFKNYPDEFNFRCKCIVVFQNLDGVDVVLFGLYVYEHNEKNPEPNKRAVYISYLDSVHFMRPRQMRTFIYHEILISYLDYLRRRGFSTAHIWACPPLKGDDYILYAKPEDQKTPKDDRLRQWYIDMLVECQRRGIVGTLTNMYDLYFADPKNDATVVPYMEGDYFPAEVENIIKDLEDGKGGKKGSSKGKSKDKKAKAKKKSGRGGTRSTGLDEEALRASGFLPPGIETKSLEEGGRDFVMAKLGETIQPMKESFIVAYLAWSGAKEENMVVPKEIEEYRAQYGIDWRLPEEDKSAEKDSSTSDGEDATSQEAKTPSDENQGTNPVEPSTEGAAGPKTITSDSVDGEPELPQPETKPDDEAEQEKTNAGTATVAEQPGGKAGPNESSGPNPMEGVTTEQANESAGGTSEQKDGEKKDSESQAAAKPAGGDKSGDPEKKPVASSMDIRSGKFAAMAARKRDREGSIKEESKEEKTPENLPKEPKSITTKDSKGRIVKVIDDDEEELDCEFLNNRQAFLNLCQGNHYQFDQLRRAKHSSMMVLWHLHNRDAPKFVQQCATCSREILSGYRFHCSTCADFDQCQECVSNPKMPRHPHQLKPMPVGNGQQAELSAAQRKERQRSIQLHMTLLLHAATCNSPKCPSANCTKMKGLLKHGSQCQVKASGGCNLCKRIWALLQLHARQCKAKACPVPNCMAIRERFRQLKKQQQAMDDRRRQEMNRAYRGKR